ncbi:MAG TPA: hypothetical protein VF779_09025 [Pyrinomonadaceae bacterium]
MSREEHLAQRQETFQLATDFTRVLAQAYEAINAGKPPAEMDARTREALSVGENYGAALDKLLSLLENEPGDNSEEIARVLRFKELLGKELELLRARPQMLHKLSGHGAKGFP